MLLLSLHSTTGSSRPVMRMVSATLDIGDEHRRGPDTVRSRSATVTLNHKSFPHHHHHHSNDNDNNHKDNSTTTTNQGQRQVHHPSLDEPTTTILTVRRSIDSRVIANDGSLPQQQHHLLGLSELTFAKTSNTKTKSKNVSFDKVSIREHSLTVGDTAWCKEGRRSIQLDWPHTVTRSIPIDDWEWQRHRQGRMPRGTLPRINLLDRTRLLRRVAGITEEDLFLAERQQFDAQYVAWHRSQMTTFYPDRTTTTTSQRQWADV